MVRIVADTHHKWADLYDMHIKKMIEINPRCEPSKLIIAGDTGYEDKYWPPMFKKHLIYPEWLDLYWIDGNHEDFNLMKKKNLFPADKLEPIKTCITKPFYYLPRGTIVCIENLNYLFVGGAESIPPDRMGRVPGYNWFPEESISQHDFNRILNNCDGKSIDVVISHCAPISYELEITRFDEEESSRLALEEILHIVKPKLWICGHYHFYKIVSGSICPLIVLPLLTDHIDIFNGNLEALTK
jgi:hypothetical protein